MRHRDPLPPHEPPSDEEINGRLARRLADLCQAAGWPHDEPRVKCALRFWPWGAARPWIKAALVVRTERRKEQISQLSYALLQLERVGVPVAAVDRHLPELQIACRRYGVALTIGTLVPRAEHGHSLVAIDLSLPVLERAMSAVSLEEAVTMFQATRLELEAICRKVEA